MSKFSRCETLFIGALLVALSSWCATARMHLKREYPRIWPELISVAPLCQRPVGDQVAACDCAARMLMAGLPHATEIFLSEWSAVLAPYEARVGFYPESVPKTDPAWIAVEAFWDIALATQQHLVQLDVTPYGEALFQATDNLDLKARQHYDGYADLHAKAKSFLVHVPGEEEEDDGAEPEDAEDE